MQEPAGGCDVAGGDAAEGGDPVRSGDWRGHLYQVCLQQEQAHGQNQSRPALLPEHVMLNTWSSTFRGFGG